jgi:hypothetical protein
LPPGSSLQLAQLSLVSPDLQVQRWLVSLLQLSLSLTLQQVKEQPTLQILEHSRLKDLFVQILQSQQLVL